MKINAAGIELIRGFEGCRLTSYLCPSGIPTIGYGSTKGVKLGVTITQSEADRLLQEDLAEAGGAIARWAADNHVAVNENEYAALVSLAFNIGAYAFANSTVARLLAKGDRLGAAKAFEMWVKGDGEVLLGLVARRSAEKQLFLSKVK